MCFAVRHTNSLVTARDTKMTTYVYAFGCNVDGQLGIKHNEGNQLKPIKVESLNGKNIIKINCSQTHSAAIGSNGFLYTCGNNDNNELGRDGRRFIFLPVLQLEAHKLIDVGCGEGFTIAESSHGSAFSIGKNNYGQLGQGHRETKNRWKTLKMGDDRIATISTGKAHSMLITKTGIVHSFGAGKVGQIGNGQFTSVTTPAICAPLKNRPIIQVCCGENHVLTLSSGGLVWAWGSNEYGQLGLSNNNNNTTTTTNNNSSSKTQHRELRPKIITSLRVARPSFLAAGGNHSMALTTSGTVFSWGKGMNGQLGHNDENNIPLPKLIIQFQDIYGIVGDLSCGTEHSMAIVYTKTKCEDGSILKQRNLYGWGLNAAGQLGLYNDNHNNGTGLINLRKILRPKKIRFFNNIVDPFNDNIKETVVRVFCGNLHTFVLTCNNDDDVKKIPTALSNSSQSPIVSFSRIEELVNNVVNNGNIRQSNEMRHLETHIIDAFSSPACLNASFLKNKNQLEDKHGRSMVDVMSVVSANNTDSGLDLSVVRKTYKMLLMHDKLSTEIKNVIKTRLTFATHRLSETIRECFFNEKENLRVFLICFENPILLEPKICHVALERLIRAIMSLSKNAREVLFLWLTKFSSEFLGQIVHVIQNFLTLIYTYKSMRSVDQTNALLLLSQIYQINQQESILPSSMFYNAAISQIPKDDLSKEYTNWLLQSSSSLAVHSLCQCPFVFETHTKRRLIRIDATKRMAENVRLSIDSFFEAVTQGAPRPELNETFFFNMHISRENLLEDAVDIFSNSNMNDMRKPLKIHFKGEDGVDEGGLTKEFCSLVVSKFLNDTTLFTLDKGTNRWWFSPPRYKYKGTQLIKEQVPVNLFELFGTLIGISIYNGVYLDLRFPNILFQHLLYLNTNTEVKPSLNDFAELRPMIAQSLQKMKNMKSNIQELDEVFSISTAIMVAATSSDNNSNTKEAINNGLYRPTVLQEDLKPNGIDIPVTTRNVDLFVELYIKSELTDRHWLGIQSIARGFQKVIACPALTLCRPHELKLLLCGISNFDNFEDLVSSSKYIDGYTSETNVVKWFWDMVITQYTEVEKRKLLFFVTGNDRIPTNGFKGLRFVIQKAGSHNDEHLPTAHTCFNTLCFPEYSSKEILKDRFSVALENLTGFGLA